jgi:hypothetical protein
MISAYKLTASVLLVLLIESTLWLPQQVVTRSMVLHERIKLVQGLFHFAAAVCLVYCLLYISECS